MPIQEKDIVASRDQLFKNVVEYFRTKEGVKAICVGGSIAAGTTDAYSDIDFKIIVSREHHKQFVSERLTMPRKWGEWRFNEWIEEAVHCVSHFKPFNKVDVFYFNEDDLKPSPWYALPVLIVHDPEDIVARLVEASQGLTFSTDLGDIDRSISRVISFSQEVYRRVRRGELIFAYAEVVSIRYFLAHLDDYVQGNPPRFVALSHYEKRGSEYIVKAIHDSHGPLNPDEILKSCVILLTAFLKQMDDLYRKFPLERSRASDEYAVNTVLDLMREGYRN